MIKYAYNIDGVSLAFEFEAYAPEGMKAEKYLGWLLAHDLASKATAKGSKNSPNRFARGTAFSPEKAAHFKAVAEAFEPLKALLPGFKVECGEYIKPEDKATEAVKAERSKMHESMKQAGIAEETLKGLFPEFYEAPKPEASPEGETPEAKALREAAEE